ncbi:hypothetical protein HKK55_09390 [Pseudomonas sp. ADAK18]|nr:hypothetical protein HKK55_09390 [Pseudomonas sp. ADAK18]
MDDFENSYKDAVEAGQRNLRASKLLSNWCFHAEFVRSPGRGMIEAETNLPIGHMGVQCKFSKMNSMQAWLLEDAAYDFYKNNCKNCDKRVPVGIPNIMDFIGPREKVAENRRRVRQEEEALRKQKQSHRQDERSKLRYKLTLEETFVLDLLDELDREGVARDDPRLEELANLAPETFSRKIVQQLLPIVLNENLPYSIPAAKAMLKASLEPDEKVSVAVRLISSYEMSSAAIDVILSGAEKLSNNDLRMIVHRFVSIALEPPPSSSFGRNHRVIINAVPFHSLFQKRYSEICGEIDLLLNDTNPGAIGGGVAIILASDNAELLKKHARKIISTLMRRRTLLPSERRDSSAIYYLREAASKLLEIFPDLADTIIQSYLADNDSVGREEASKIYRSVLKSNYREVAKIGDAQRIAFKRLLWIAMQTPEDGMSDAGQFFRHSWDEFSKLGSEFFYELVGAAATLSQRYEDVDAERPLEFSSEVLEEMDRRNRRASIENLQAALIEWAAIGAKSKGREGVEDFLKLYRNLPQEQAQMRGKMISHFSKLLSGVESITLVLSDWYRALMDESAVVRCSAVQAWEKVPYALVKNFPDLFLESISVLLADPYVIVHRAAVRTLRHRPFPKEKRNFINGGLWNLVLHYSKKGKQEEFVVDCLDALVFLCLSPEEKKGSIGSFISGILIDLEGHALYHAIDRLHYGFEDVPGFVKVALKSIQSGYTRSISIDDCASVILKTSHFELKGCVDEMRNAFFSLKPFKPNNFFESLLYSAALSKAGEYAVVSTCLRELITSIPAEARNEQWRLEVDLVATASDIENAIETGNELGELIESWGKTVINLECENEERSKLRNIPPSFFFED